MRKGQITLTTPVGLHARPAAEFVQTATCFQAEITVANVEKSKGRLKGLAASGGVAVGHAWWYERPALTVKRARGEPRRGARTTA